MGNDGGSIARRDELVKVKASTLNPKSRAKSTQKQRWTTCALSREPLREPVVADALGRMYNKEAVAEWLIERAMKKAEGKEVPDAASMSHIKGFKDLTTLKLTPNPSFKSTAEDASSSDDTLPLAQTPFLCPLTSRPMNGTIRFVYIRTEKSGAVMSESALKATASESSKCPVTETPFNPGSLAGKNGAACLDAENVGDVILINPLPGSEEEKVLVEAIKRAKKSGKDKRKRGVGEEAGDAKKVKVSEHRKSPDHDEAKAGGDDAVQSKEVGVTNADRPESKESSTNGGHANGKSNDNANEHSNGKTAAKTAKA